MKQCLIIFFMSALLYGCRTHKVYIPVETVRAEYQDKLRHDSIFLHDSVLIRAKGDTMFVEKYRYLYRDRFLRDSVFVRDSVQVPYPVVETLEISRVSGFQNFQIWCGRILLVLLLGYFGLRLWKWR